MEGALLRLAEGLLPAERPTVQTAAKLNVLSFDMVLP